MVIRLAELVGVVVSIMIIVASISLFTYINARLNFLIEHPESIDSRMTDLPDILGKPSSPFGMNIDSVGFYLMFSVFLMLCCLIVVYVYLSRK